MLQDYSSDGRRSRDYTIAKYVNEITLSYSLLFRCDKKARKEFQTRWKTAADKDGTIDPVLEELCSGTAHHFRLLRDTSYKQPVRETFDAASDFPILSNRLDKIQRFVDSIQPNRMSSLWKDKRDILRWYTFWAVVVLGGINLVVAIVQTALSSAQVQLARAALELQKREQAPKPQ